jgi:O-antigen/teichoic acid export membrane protein
MSTVADRILALQRRSSFVLDTTGVLVLNLSTMVLNFATIVVLGRLLGSQGFGAYAFAIAWATLLTVPAALGLPPLIIRTVASSGVRAEWGRMRGVVRRANQATLAASAITLLVAAPVGWVVLRSNDDLRAPFMIALALIPIIALTSVRGGAMNGLGRVVLGRATEAVVRPGLFLSAVGITYVLVGDRLAPTGVTGLQVAMSTVALVIGVIFLRRSFPAEARHAQAVYETRAWLRSAIPLAAMSGIGVLNAQIGLILLGVMLGAAETGTFAVAARAAAVISFVFTTARFALAPEVARLHTLDRRDELQRLVTRAGRAIFFFTLPVAVAIVLGAETVLGLFGAGFGDGATALRILCIGELTAVATGYAASVLLMTGHELQTTKWLSLGGIVNVALSPIFIVLWGLEGAAAATATGVVLANIGLALGAWRQVRIYSPVIGLSRALR